MPPTKGIQKFLFKQQRRRYEYKKQLIFSVDRQLICNSDSVWIYLASKIIPLCGSVLILSFQTPGKIEIFHTKMFKVIVSEKRRREKR